MWIIPCHMGIPLPRNTKGGDSVSTSCLIASGKGGVGKSVITANLGAALASRGFSVAVIDADIGLRSQDAMFGLADSVVYDLIDVLNDDCALEQALLEVPSVPGLKLLPAAQFARARSLGSRKFSTLLTDMKLTFDYILIDAPAGIEKGFRSLLNALPDEIILITTADELCIRDAERAAQVIDKKELSRPQLIVNRLDNELIRRREMMTAGVISASLDLPLLGEIPDDPAVYRSILRRNLFLDYDCPARSAVLRIASRMAGETVPFPSFGSQRIPLLRRLFSKDLKEVTPLERH